MPKHRLLTPGPVPVPERIRLAMAHPLVHHRSPAFGPLFREVGEGLRQVFQTAEPVLVLASSGTGAMESAVANVTRRGDRVLVIRAGKFGERWAELCEAYGVAPVCIDVEWGEAVSPARVAEVLAAEPDVRAVFVQASETSTGVLHPIREIAREVRQGSQALLVVDGISAVGVHPLPMDAWGIDVLLSGSQKAWALPPGLSLVALSPRAQAALERSDHPRYYLDLRRELRLQPTGQTGFSPAVSLIVGLRESLRMVLEQGLDAAFARHAQLARMVRAAAGGLGLELLAPDAPSHACTALCIPPGIDGAKLLADLRDRHGIVLAGGQGRLAGQIIRIGHMGDIDAHDTLAAVAALEAVLSEAGHPVDGGAGVQRAMQALRTVPAAPTLDHP